MVRMFMVCILRRRAAVGQWASAAALAAALLGGWAAPAGAQELPPEQAEHLYTQALQAMAANNLPAAQELLQRLVDGRPDHAGAWLDMAVLYCQLGNNTQAQALWSEVETRFAPPPAILELIALQREQGCASPLPQAGLQAQLQVSRGASSNVNQGVRDLAVGLNGPAGTLVLQLLPEYAPRADRYTLLSGGATQQLNSAGLEGFAQWQGRWLDTEKRFNVKDLTVGLAQPWDIGAWRGRWQLGTGTTALGGTAYQRHQQAQARATPPWQPLGAWRWSLAGGLSRLDYPTLPAFDAWQWDARLQLEQATPLGQLQVYGGAAQDHGNTQRPGGNRDGASLGLEWQQPLGEVAGQTWVARLGLDWQWWKSRALYSPGFIELRRAQRTFTGTAALVLALSPDEAWVLEARQVHNNENIGLFVYDAYSLQLSYQKRWGRVNR
jgi:Tetratricopeptide repeat